MQMSLYVLHDAKNNGKILAPGWNGATCMINLLNLGQLLVMLDFMFDSIH
jgi:hypothetical protein